MRLTYTFLSFVCFQSIAMMGLYCDLAVAQESAKKAVEQLVLADGKLTLDLPSNWKKVPPKSPIIQNEYRAPDEKETSARITVSTAGGGIDANIDRWITQFSGAKRTDAKIEKKQVSGQTVHIVDLTGTYEERTGGPMAGGPITKMENHRLIGAIIESQQNGAIFIKMLGPKDTVEKLVADFKKSLEGMKAK